MGRSRWHASPFSWWRNKPDRVREVFRIIELARLLWLVHGVSSAEEQERGLENSMVGEER